MDCALRTASCELQTVHCELCTADYGLCYLKRNGTWDAYLESVQYGLDYVLGRWKCLRISNCLSVSKGKRVYIITPHLTFDVTNISQFQKKGGGVARG